MTTTHPRSRILAPLIGLTAAFTLILTGCSGTGSPERSTAPAMATQTAAVQPAKPATNVYDFTPNAPRQAEKELTVVLPKSLMDQLPDKVPYVTKIVVKAHPINSIDRCALDAELTFNPAITQAQIDDAYKNPTGNINNAAGTGAWKPMADFSETAGSGIYFTPDFRKVTRLMDCAKSPADKDYSSLLSLNLLAMDKGTGDRNTFAKVELLTTKAGTITLRKGEIGSYTMDYQGNWVRK